MTTSVNQVLTLNNIGGWTKNELTDLALSSVAEVADNGDDTLGLLALSAKLEYFAGEVKKAAKERGIVDLAKYGKKGAAIAGVQLSIRETGVSYDYSSDQAWQEMNREVLRATGLRKEHEELLKKLPYGGMGLTNPFTGETYHARPPLKSGKESIVASIL